jgi:hypothetical protein
MDTSTVKKTNENVFPSPFASPCGLSVFVCKEGCEGCNTWEKHYGTDCKEMLFCCLPCTSIIDILCLIVTVPKWLCNKNKP